jgi:Domain of unknown function (DUF5710)
MRVNLNVPYKEKDEANRLGAKWDLARKIWYVENVENLELFLKWIPEHLKKPVGNQFGKNIKKTNKKVDAKKQKNK